MYYSNAPRIPLGRETGNAKREDRRRMGDEKNFLGKRYVFIRSIAYLRYIEHEGGKPSTRYQNPGTIRYFAKPQCFRSNSILYPPYRTRRGQPSALYQSPAALVSHSGAFRVIRGIWGDFGLLLGSLSFNFWQMGMIWDGIGVTLG